MGRYLTPLAVVLVVAAVVIIVTSGESIAVRYLVGLVSLDVAAPGALGASTPDRERLTSSPPGGEDPWWPVVGGIA